ncbi:MAG: hypothetical protein F4W92_05565 [Gammaproteobacteria bacterium]|nr:hypothetical protein [Gammaproteobacteria bacterium]
MNELRRNLDLLARKGSRYLRRFALKGAMEKAWPLVGIVALLFPLGYFGYRCYEVYEAFQATATGASFSLVSVGWGLMWTVLIALLIPAAFWLLLYSLESRRYHGAKESLARAWPVVFLLAIAFPVGYCVSYLFQILGQYATVSYGFSPFLSLAVLLAVVLVVAIPVVFIGLWAFFGFSFGRIDRQTSLALFDRELGLKDRLQSADEFRVKEQATPFEQAAITDAMPHAEQALQTRLANIDIAKPAMDTIKWPLVFAAMFIFVLGLSTNGLQFETSPVELAMVWHDDHVDPNESEEDVKPPIFPDEKSTEQDVPEPDAPVAEEQKPTEMKKATEATNSESSLAESDEAQSVPQQTSESGLSASASKQNQPGQAASNIAGLGNEKQKKEEEVAQKKKPKKSDPEKENDSKEEEKDDSASGIAGGKGTGSGKQSASTEMLEQHSRSREDDFDQDVDQESDDEEDEEQEAASAAKPMLNQRKAPVDRQLTPSGVGFEENEDANGRGGPGGLKKTRGVAAMLLGVPMPDKLRSQINVGRIKVQRERSIPIPNQVQTTNSENRGQMDDSVGTFSRTELKPWMRDVAKKYFLDLRQSNNSDN